MITALGSFCGRIVEFHPDKILYYRGIWSIKTNIFVGYKDKRKEWIKW